MKVALILYGQPRFVDRPDVIFNHRVNIIGEYSTDVFAQMWFSPEDSYGPTASWADFHGADHIIPSNAEYIVANKWLPKKMRVDHPRTFYMSEEVRQILDNRFMGNQFYSHSNISNICSQMMAIDRAMKLAYEDETEYDFYVLARYDATLVRFPDLTTLDREFFYLPHGGHFNDLVHIWSNKQRFGRIFEGLVDRVLDDATLAREIELPIPELYKFEAFRPVFDYAKKIDMYADVIRC